MRFLRCNLTILIILLLNVELVDGNLGRAK
jgi:hypothetical protein